MRELRADTLVVFVSDSHIGGDPGCDGFESPAELAALFRELASRTEPVDLILAGDFFDFLQIGTVPKGMDRAKLTISRPEYEDLFATLRELRATEGKRVIYLPGNHDAEAFWNPGIQETLGELGLVDEFAYNYLASLPVGDERRVIYCEHGNQFDAANTVDDYHDPLDTPLGHHVVMDFTRRVAPFGEISRGLDLAEIKMVYPLVAIPGWVASRYFYDLAGKAIAYLLVPIFASYILYRLALLSVLVGEGRVTVSVLGSSREFTAVHRLFVDVGIFALIVLLIFAIFFVAVRHAIRRIMVTMSLGERPQYSPAQVSENKVREILQGDVRPPMAPSLDPTEVDVFVSGHTHLPSLSETTRPDGSRAVLVNSGCWLRQLHPVAPRVKGPPVFVSEFVLTYVLVHVQGSELRVDLWEKPKPAPQRLTRIERLLSWGLRPSEPPPDAPARIRASAAV